MEGGKKRGNNVGEDREEGGRQDILARCWAGCGGRVSSQSRQAQGCRRTEEGGGDEETEINSVRTGFIPPGPQNWAGPGRKSEEERAGGGAAVLFLSFQSELKCFREEKRDTVCEQKTFVHTVEHLCMRKFRVCIFALSDQSIKGLLPLGRRTPRAKHLFVIAKESHTSERATEARRRQRQRKSEVTLRCPQHRGKSPTPRLIKHWK